MENSTHYMNLKIDFADNPREVSIIDENYNPFYKANLVKVKDIKSGRLFFLHPDELLDNPQSNDSSLNN